MRDTGKEDKKQKVRLENGQVVSNKRKKNLYPSMPVVMVEMFWLLHGGGFHCAAGY